MTWLHGNRCPFEDAQAGAIGTALVVVAGIQGADVHEISRRFVKVDRTYAPDRGSKKVYERNYKVFKKLYKSNAAHFKALNGN